MMIIHHAGTHSTQTHRAACRAAAPPHRTPATLVSLDPATFYALAREHGSRTMIHVKSNSGGGIAAGDRLDVLHHAAHGG